MTLPIDPKARKALPIMTGVCDYFPDAVAAVSGVSKAGNDQHNPGLALGWTRGLSGDHADTAVRHLMERGQLDADGQRHTAKAAWRILAELQEEIERDTGCPISRGSRTIAQWEAQRDALKAAQEPEKEPAYNFPIALGWENIYSTGGCTCAICRALIKRAEQAAESQPTGMTGRDPTSSPAPRRRVRSPRIAPRKPSKAPAKRRKGR